MLIDLHTHLTYGKHDKDLDDVIKRAKENNVKVIINAGTSPEQNRKTLDLAKKYQIVKPALGFYPLDMLKFSDKEIDEELKWIKSKVNNPENNSQEIIALSEIGMDFHYDKENHEKQKQNFIKFINLAKEVNLPMIIHSRDAEQEMIDLLKQHNCKKVVMHCFSGSKEQLKEIIDNGWYITIPTSICLRKSFRKILKNIPLENVFTETDAPWMSPHKEIKRNEPAFIKKEIEKIAKLKKMDVKEVENIIHMNFQKLFL